MTIPFDRIVARLAERGLLVDAAEPREQFGGIAVHGITTDSRHLERGDLFCAVRGTAGDGHSFLGGAREAGAVAALVETVDRGVDLPQVAVTNGRLAAAHAAAVFYRDPWDELSLIGVTGTNGKTTTVSILRHLLARAEPAASLGTLGLIGSDGSPVPGTEGLTTPGPTQFAALIRRLVDQGIASVAMEVSSHALDQERVAAARFTAGIFTNLSRDHLDYHGDLEAYRAAKLKLVELIRPGGILAPNADDPAWAELRREGVHLVRFGVSGRGEVQAEKVVHTDVGTRWTLLTPSCTAEVELPLTGIHNVYNALGAAAVLWGLGWTADRIGAGFAELGQVRGRMERIRVAGGPTIVIDFAHTPDALQRALEALRPVAEGRLILVFGAGGDRDRGKRSEMGRVAAEHADLTIVTSDNPRHEDPLVIAADIESGMGAAPHDRILDRREAIARAIDIAGPEDLVLLAGKGHETYQIWGDEIRPFDERQIVGEILQQRGISN